LPGPDVSGQRLAVGVGPRRHARSHSLLDHGARPDRIPALPWLTVLTFAVLAACFEELEHTSSRKQLTTLLADLLGQVGPDEIAEVSYLLQGRVAPLYEPIEFGLGERSIERAVAQAYGIEPQDVRTRYARPGDLG